MTPPESCRCVGTAGTARCPVFGRVMGDDDRANCAASQAFRDLFARLAPPAARTPPPATPTEPGTVTITTAKIEELRKDPRLAAEFPFLRDPPMKESCGCDGKPKGLVPDDNALKEAIGEMPDDRKAVFAELAGLPKFKVVYSHASRSKTVHWPA